MSHPRPEATAMADISANLFAVLILILVLIVSIGPKPTDPPAQTTPQQPVVDLLADARLVERATQTPIDMVAMLRRRTSLEGAVNLDIGPKLLHLSGLGLDESWPLPLRDGDLAAIIGLTRSLASQKLQVFVFDHHGYPSILSLLRDLRRRDWAELSVPMALRSEDEAGWSDGFRQLIGRGLDQAAFRSELAKLLNGRARSDMRNWDQFKGAAPSLPMRPQSTPQLTSWDEWLAWGNSLLTWGAIIGIALFIIRVERLMARRRREALSLM